MVYDQCFCTGRIDDGRGWATAVIEDDYITKGFLRHGLPLALIMHSNALGQQVHVDEVRWESKSRQGAVQDDTRAETVGVLVRHDQRALASLGTAMVSDSNLVLRRVTSTNPSKNLWQHPWPPRARAR